MESLQATEEGVSGCLGFGGAARGWPSRELVAVWPQQYQT